MKSYKKTLFFLFIFPFVVYGGSSIFGIGSGKLGMFQNQYSATALGRGGTEMGFADSLGLNQVNFATWAFISRSSISLNLNYDGLTTETINHKVSSYDANFYGGYLAMPILSNKLAMGIGINPVALNNQKLEIPNVGIDAEASEIIETKGNLSEAKFIIAYAPHSQFAVAAVAMYNFGMITDRIMIEYKQTGFGDINIENQYQFTGTGFGMDLFYQPSEKIAAGMGIKFPFKYSMNTSQTSISNSSTADNFKRVTIPMQLRGGIIYQVADRWITAMDLQFSNWESGYKIDAKTVTDMHNSFKLGAGAEYRPGKRRFIPYIDKMTFRGGLFYGQMNVTSNGKPVDEYGMSIGLGLPFSGIYNRFDISFEIGKRGSIETNLTSENFFRINFTLSTSELWFEREER